ncbi:TfoX/Sxy family protein [Silvimonas sp.]|uniref:TfoX/Sxy family protein n=1 Tax=Silvimonas sp. TaxID=2650811 RepID=UPI00284D0374|nr:TfoX/Sxy family protein [Silvimonas sp.]MDR3425883.1 TfoX/Sxy family protein [Silvimonas sp.]
MPAKSEYLEWLVEQLAPLGHIRVKSMFGGYGLYCDEVFFALIADDVFYVKVDDTSRPRFEAEQLQPFMYRMKDGCQQTMSYYPLPENTLEDPEAIRDWSREGIGAGLRAATSKNKKKK